METNQPSTPASPGSPEHPEKPAGEQPYVYVAKSRKKWAILLGLLAILILGTGYYLWQTQEEPVKRTTSTSGSPAAKDPTLEVTEVLADRSNVWDIQFLPTQELLFTERNGTLSAFIDGKVRSVATIADVKAQGEGGLMGLAVDPNFEDNRYIYTCYNTATDIRVVRWELTDELTGLENRKDIITGIPSNPSGRHSGCRLAFGPDTFLWVGTGDSAQAMTPQTPQDPKSLGGKILRVDRDGRAAAGNLDSPFDARIYSYGHRNTQGLAFFDEKRGNVLGISAEHGSDVDDEINPLQAGNFGWAPPDGRYDESVAMTDKKRFPNAVDAIWSSGDPTQAPAGVAALKGADWGTWEGGVVVAMLKAQHLKLLVLDDKLAVSGEKRLYEGQYGRLRAVTLGPDGALYVGTSNGSADKILKITPEQK